ncbi:hypothetical protein [Halolamina sp.]|uniref:hypothetical protein n=1 Tax=Halolamina sp. TaxID=1940283 RepID=UPI0035662FDF
MPLLSPESLARTYNPPIERDVWNHVQLYRQTQRYPDDWGGARVSSAINTDDEQPFEGLSRSNVRAWVDGDGMPDAARAVEVADGLGWLANEWTPTTRALAQLVAGIFACGSVDRRGWLPGWAVERVSSELEAALDQVGVGHQWVARETNSQADELRPAAHGSILGRALVVAGVSVGDKTAATVRSLPDWLDGAPPSVRASFAELLVAERGSERPGKATLAIQANRSRQYFEDVRGLLEDVTGESVTASDAGVTISADAVRALGLA